MATYFRSVSGRRAQILDYPEHPQFFTLIVSRLNSPAPAFIRDYKSAGACLKRMRSFESDWAEVDYLGDPISGGACNG